MVKSKAIIFKTYYIRSLTKGGLRWKLGIAVRNQMIVHIDLIIADV
ncbi:hypothetical protein [Clostridium sp. YIM B02555]|nr:hypothetical protein [Clostridium sp. YIM B02555]